MLVDLDVVGEVEGDGVTGDLALEVGQVGQLRVPARDGVPGHQVVEHDARVGHGGGAGVPLRVDAAAALGQNGEGVVQGGLVAQGRSGHGEGAGAGHGGEVQGAVVVDQRSQTETEHAIVPAEVHAGGVVSLRARRSKFNNKPQYIFLGIVKNSLY